MKWLFVSSVPTHPTTSGNRARILNLVEAVERLGHEVHFALVNKSPRQVEPSMTIRFGQHLHVLSYQPRRRVAWAGEHLRRRMQRVLGQEAAFRWSLDAWYDEQLTGMLQTLQSTHRFEAVCIEYVFLSRALEAFDGSVRKIIDTHDRFTDRHRMFLGAPERYEWFSVTEADEARGLARADCVVAIQQDEGDAFRRLLPSRVAVETVGHVFDPAVSVERARACNAIVVGSANAINVEAVRYFCGEVMPRVQRRLPAFGLLVAGDVGAHVPDGPGIVKLGRVPDMSQAYRQAALAVNPVRSGTGLCIKTLETMAFGVPLVTTRSGARGLEAFEGSAFVAVGNEDAAAMADALVDLLQHEARADALGRAGRDAALAFNAAQLASLRRVVGGVA